jgi:hypothetical protein
MKEVVMKRSVLMMSGTLLVVFLLASMAMAEETGKMETAIGEVTSVDPQGTAITFSWNVGKDTLVVGTIVDKDTMVKIKGKTADVQDIKVGDTVTVRFLKSDNLYAKEITKK